MTDPDRVSELSAIVAFNVIYAAIQHEELSFEHPRGGQAKYLENPLKEKITDYERDLGETFENSLAASVKAGKSLTEAAEDAKHAVKRRLLQLALDLMGEAQRIAPIEEGVLRASASVEVFEDGDLDAALAKAAEEGRRQIEAEFPDLDIDAIRSGEYVADDALIFST